MRKQLGMVAAAVGFSLAAASAHATAITQVFTVALPDATPYYEAGHVFEITVSYNDAGTFLREWSNGPNQISELGGGDDNLVGFTDIYDFKGYHYMSDAQISVSGLADAPAGATPINVGFTNRSWITENGDSVQHVNFAFGNLFSQLVLDPLGSTTFQLYTNYNTANGPISQRAVYSGASAGVVTSQVVSVPEPSTLALFGLGAFGMLLSRRRLRA